MRIPHAEVVDGGAIATAQLAAGPNDLAAIGHHDTAQIHVVARAASHDQGAVGRYGDKIGGVPVARQPGQSATDDVCAGQQPGVLPRVGTRHGAVQREIPHG